MTGQHWDELARSVCKTKAISVMELCRYMGISYHQYYVLANKGLSDAQRVFYCNKLRKLMVDVAYAM